MHSYVLIMYLYRESCAVFLKEKLIQRITEYSFKVEQWRGTGYRFRIVADLSIIFTWTM